MQSTAHQEATSSPAPLPAGLHPPSSLPAPCSDTLPTGSTCKAGTFSLGGGKRWDNWPVSRLPAPFKTYCRSRSDDAPSAPDNCKGWVGAGAFVSSGETGDGMESVLEMHVELTTAGRVVYIHRVDAEVPYDGLYAKILHLPFCNHFVTVFTCMLR